MATIRLQGSWSGSTLTLWVDDELVKGVVSRPAVLEAVQAQAQARTGGSVQVRVQVGKAPAEGSAPGAPAAEHDNLDDLLALGRQFDNIIIKE